MTNLVLNFQRIISAISPPSKAVLRILLAILFSAISHPRRKAIRPIPTIHAIQILESRYSKRSSGMRMKKTATATASATPGTMNFSLVFPCLIRIKSARVRSDTAIRTAFFGPSIYASARTVPMKQMGTIYRRSWRQLLITSPPLSVLRDPERQIPHREDPLWERLLRICCGRSTPPWRYCSRSAFSLPSARTPSTR